MYKYRVTARRIDFIYIICLYQCGASRLIKSSHNAQATHCKPSKPKCNTCTRREGNDKSIGGICTIVNRTFVCGSKHQFLGVIVKPSTPCPLPAAALRAPDVGVVTARLNPSSDALELGVGGFEAPFPRPFIVIDSPSIACALLGAALTTADTGVVDRVGT